MGLYRATDDRGVFCLKPWAGQARAKVAMLSITSVGLLLDSQELRCPREDTKAPRPRRHQPAWLPGKGTVSNCPGAFFGPVSRLPDGSSGVLAGGVCLDSACFV